MDGDLGGRNDHNGIRSGGDVAVVYEFGRCPMSSIPDEQRFQEIERQRSREQYSRQVADLQGECRKERKRTDFGPVYNEESYK